MVCIARYCMVEKAFSTLSTWVNVTEIYDSFDLSLTSKAEYPDILHDNHYKL